MLRIMFTTLQNRTVSPSVQSHPLFIWRNSPATKRSNSTGKVYLDRHARTQWTLLFMRADTPYKSIEDIRRAKEPPKCSATGVGTAGHLIPRLLEETLNLKFQLVTAIRRRRARLGPGTRRSSMPCHYCAAFFGREPFISWYKKSVVRILVQTSRKPHGSIPEVPTLWSLWKKKRHRTRSSLSHRRSGSVDSVLAHRSTRSPSALRYALRPPEPDFLGEAKKGGWKLRPVGGVALEA